MKNLKHSSLVFLLTLLLSCQTDLNNENQEFPNYKLLAELHTDGLNEVLSDLKSDLAQGQEYGRKLDRVRLLRMSGRSTAQFVKNRFPDLSEKELQTIQSESISISDRLNLDRIGRNLELRTQSRIVGYKDLAEELGVEKFLNEFDLSLIDKVFEIVNRPGISFQEMQVEFSKLEQEIQAVQSQNTDVLTIAVEIAKASTSYWESNFEVWASATNSDGHSQGRTKAISWGVVAGTDIAGCVGAALACKYLAAMPLGWKFCAAYIAGVTVLSSAGAVLIML